MKHSRIIDSWIAELRVGARTSRRQVAGGRRFAQEHSERHAHDGRPLAARLLGEAQPVRELSPCLGT
jgi:hypothetical protein